MIVLKPSFWVSILVFGSITIAVMMSVSLASTTWQVHDGGQVGWFQIIFVCFFTSNVWVVATQILLIFTLFWDDEPILTHIFQMG